MIRLSLIALIASLATLMPLNAEARSRIITDDIVSFLAAMRAAEQLPEAERAAVYQREYLDRGSPGLQDFVAAGRIKDAETLATAVRTHPRYYASLGTFLDRLAAKQEDLDGVFTGMASLYPEGSIPAVYFVVGHFWSSGTVSRNGMLLGTEVWAVSEGVPLDEFAAHETGWVHPFDEIPYNLAHEMTHTQQAWQGKNTLLEKAIVEGTAELVAELLVPNAPILPMRAWADANAAEVWRRFQEDMAGTDTSEWIANNDRERPDWPAALAYYVGYKIARGYYDGCSDKAQAIKDLFALTDAPAILRASGFKGAG